MWAYVGAALHCRAALVPSIAFCVVMVIAQLEIQQAIIHAASTVCYLALIPISPNRVLWGMFASLIVNFLAAFYFVSPAYLVDFEVYFMTAMIVINLYILLTIFTGVKDAKPYALGDTASVSYMDLQHIQTHTTQNKRG